MNPTSILSLAASAHVLVMVKHGRLVAEGDQEAVARILPLLRQHKDILLAHFAHTLDGIRYAELYQERAAMHEYDGGIQRHEAEQQAYQSSLEAFIRTNYPMILAQFEALIFSPIMQ